DLQLLRIAAGHLKRRRADVGAAAAGARNLAQQRQQEAARAGAHIENSQALVRLPALLAHDLERRLDQRLRIWPGIERGWRAGKWTAIELPPPQDARDWLVLRAAGHMGV